MIDNTQYKHKWWVLFAISFAVLLINVEITAVNLIIAPIGGKIVDKIGMKIPASIGLIAFIIGLISFSLISVHTLYI